MNPTSESRHDTWANIAQGPSERNPPLLPDPEIPPIYSLLNQGPRRRAQPRKTTVLNGLRQKTPGRNNNSLIKPRAQNLPTGNKCRPQPRKPALYSDRGVHHLLLPSPKPKLTGKNPPLLPHPGVPPLLPRVIHKLPGRSTPLLPDPDVPPLLPRPTARRAPLLPDPPIQSMFFGTRKKVNTTSGSRHNQRRTLPRPKPPNNPPLNVKPNIRPFCSPIHKMEASPFAPYDDDKFQEFIIQFDQKHLVNIGSTVDEFESVTRRNSAINKELQRIKESCIGLEEKFESTAQQVQVLQHRLNMQCKSHKDHHNFIQNLKAEHKENCRKMFEKKTALQRDIDVTQQYLLRKVDDLKKAHVAGQQNLPREFNVKKALKAELASMSDPEPSVKNCGGFYHGIGSQDQQLIASFTSEMRRLRSWRTEEVEKLKQQLHDQFILNLELSKMLENENDKQNLSERVSEEDSVTESQRNPPCKLKTENKHNSLSQEKPGEERQTEVREQAQQEEALQKEPSGKASPENPLGEAANHDPTDGVKNHGKNDSETDLRDGDGKKEKTDGVTQRDPDEDVCCDQTLEGDLKRDPREIFKAVSVEVHEAESNEVCEQEMLDADSEGPKEPEAWEKESEGPEHLKTQCRVASISGSTWKGFQRIISQGKLKKEKSLQV